MSWVFSRVHKPRIYRCRVCKEELKLSYKYGYCQKCIEGRAEDVKKYEQRLELRRKYTKGEKLTSIDDLDCCEYVYWNNMIRHVEFIKSLQLRLVLESIRRGYLFSAIKKEVSHGE